VLKFGGTSVSSVSNWHNIARVLRERIAEGLRPVVVHSALSGITDRLESLLTAAAGGAHGLGLDGIERTHRDLAQALGVEPGAGFEVFLEELKSLTAEIAGSHQIDERRRALAAVAGISPIGRRAQPKETAELRRRGIVAYPEDIGVQRAQARRYAAVLAVENQADLQ